MKTWLNRTGDEKWWCQQSNNCLGLCQCVTNTTDYYKWFILKSWFTSLEQTNNTPTKIPLSMHWSKRQSLSKTTVLSRTALTRTITLDRLQYRPVIQTKGKKAKAVIWGRTTDNVSWSKLHEHFNQNNFQLSERFFLPYFLLSYSI